VESRWRFPLRQSGRGLPHQSSQPVARKPHCMAKSPWRLSSVTKPAPWKAISGCRTGLYYIRTIYVIFNSNTANIVDNQHVALDNHLDFDRFVA
jgi:hypothetical protein